MDITIVGLDLAKNVFQVHGIDSAGDTFEDCVGVLCPDERLR